MLSATTPSPLTGGGLAPNTKSTTAKSAIRRPNLVRKRDEANPDQEHSNSASSPVKKAKVSFNEDVEVNVVNEWDKAPAIIREEVHRALQRHALGDSSGYEKLKEVYKTDGEDSERPPPDQVTSHTAALLGNVAMLNRRCSALVNLLLRSDWARREEHYVSLFIKFLGSLIPAQSVWLASTLEALVGMFLSVPPLTAEIKDLPLVTPAQIRSRIHSALCKILQEVPTAANVLPRVLNNFFPQPSHSKQAHVRYIHNIFSILEYCPELRPDIFALVTDRAVKIDVQIQDNIADLEDEISEDIVRTLTRSREEIMDEDDEDESDDESDLEEDFLDSEARAGEKIAALVEKLDLLLDSMFERYHTLFSDPNESGIALDILLSHFNNLILPTFRSRHAQFLLFHFAQSSPQLIDIFLGVLLKTISDKSRTTILREAAAAYLASFVARGLHVSSSITRDVFFFLRTRLSQIRAQVVPNCRGPDRQQYGIYYAMTQALLYIFCFRWRDLVATADDSITPSPPSMLYSANEIEDPHPTFLPGVRDALSENVFCPLNPLRVCVPVIAQEFARISHHLGVVYVISLLETNKNVRLAQTVYAGQRETALGHLKSGDGHGLDGYFPFDPYKLPRSKRWIEGDYREWTRIPGLDDDEDVSDSEEEVMKENEREDADEGTGTEGEDEE